MRQEEFLQGCNYNHSTFLHRKATNPDDAQKLADPKDENANPHQPSQSMKRTRKNGYVNVGGKSRKTRVTGLPIVPVKVKAKGHARTVET